MNQRTAVFHPPRLPQSTPQVKRVLGPLAFKVGRDSVAVEELPATEWRATFKLTHDCEATLVMPWDAGLPTVPEMRHGDKIGVAGKPSSESTRPISTAQAAKDGTAMFTEEESAWLERRLLPVGVDMIFWGMGCALLAYSVIAQLQFRNARIGMAVAVVLAGAAVIENLTGLSPGKFVCGWAVRQTDGTRPPLWRLAVRGGTRLLPVAIFLSSLASPEPLVRLVIMFAALTLLACYVPACYIALVRRRLTAFDAMAGTRLVRTQRRMPSGTDILPERRYDD